MAAGFEKKQTDKTRPRIFRTAAITAAFIAGILLISSAGIKIYDLVRRTEERKIASEFGIYDPADAGGHSLNVVTYGNENGHTIVFLSGLGIEDMCITYRDMTDILAGENRIVFIDRAGYGLSDDSLTPMTVKQIVDEYRKALDNSGIKGPVILAAHSLGGVYATYWESVYPGDVEAVVLFDSTQLEEETFPKGKPENKHSLPEILLNKTGLYRLSIAGVSADLPANADLQDEEAAQAMSYLMSTSSLWNFAMDSEYDLIRDNCKTTWDSIVTNDIPKIYICASWASETEQKYIDARNNILIPYLQKMGNCELKLLPGSHLIYEQRPEECADLIKELIKKI
ncbi:MAG: alpha/beta hydrolase [Saccharofermentans sp.]|nr:alpha/beta hydrolase [Saccharofermentans sp.]